MKRGRVTKWVTGVGSLPSTYHLQQAARERTNQLHNQPHCICMEPPYLTIALHLSEVHDC